MGSKPKASSYVPPPVPEIIPTIAPQLADSSNLNIRDQSNRRYRGAGQNQTILTGGQGLSAPNTGKTLLGM